MTIQEQIDDVRRFLRACEMTGYMMPDQILLLRLALNALEERECKKG